MLASIVKRAKDHAVAEAALNEANAALKTSQAALLAAVDRSAAPLAESLSDEALQKELTVAVDNIKVNARKAIGELHTAYVDAIRKQARSKETECKEKIDQNRLALKKQVQNEVVAVEEKLRRELAEERETMLREIHEQAEAAGANLEGDLRSRLKAAESAAASATEMVKVATTLKKESDQRALSAEATASYLESNVREVRQLLATNVMQLYPQKLDWLKKLVAVVEEEQDGRPLHAIMQDVVVVLADMKRRRDGEFETLLIRCNRYEEKEEQARLKAAREAKEMAMEADGSMAARAKLLRVKFMAANARIAQLEDQVSATSGRLSKREEELTELRAAYVDLKETTEGGYAAMKKMRTELQLGRMALAKLLNATAPVNPAAATADVGGAAAGGSTGTVVGAIATLDQQGSHAPDYSQSAVVPPSPWRPSSPAEDSFGGRGGDHLPAGATESFKQGRKPASLKQGALVDGRVRVQDADGRVRRVGLDEQLGVAVAGMDANASLSDLIAVAGARCEEAVEQSQQLSERLVTVTQEAETKKKRLESDMAKAQRALKDESKHSDFSKLLERATRDRHNFEALEAIVKETDMILSGALWFLNAAGRGKRIDQMAKQLAQRFSASQAALAKAANEVKAAKHALYQKSTDLERAMEGAEAMTLRALAEKKSERQALVQTAINSLQQQRAHLTRELSGLRIQKQPDAHLEVFAELPIASSPTRWPAIEVAAPSPFVQRSPPIIKRTSPRLERFTMGSRHCSAPLLPTVGSQQSPVLVQLPAGGSPPRAAGGAAGGAQALAPPPSPEPVLKTRKGLVFSGGSDWIAERAAA